MIIDATRLAPDLVFDCDVCIAGAGPAGIALALELASAGLQVVVLAGGGLALDGRTQRLARGESVGRPSDRLDRVRLRRFGGSSGDLWSDRGGYRARPATAADLAARPEHGVEGWPFDVAHLEPYYQRAYAYAGVSTDALPGGAWEERSGLPGLDATGEVFGTLLVQRAQGDAFLETRTFFEAATNMRLLLNAHLVDVVTAPRDCVRAFVARATDGTPLRVRAREFVLALGGIENARMLLAANDGGGLGNEHGQVGRWFHDGLALAAGVIEPSDVAWVEAAGAHARRDSTTRVHEGWLALRDDVLRDRGLLQAALHLVPDRSRRTSPAVVAARGAWCDRGSEPRKWAGREHARAVAAGSGDLARYAGDLLRPGRAPFDRLTVEVVAEQTPDAESRVTLGTRRDDLGVPQAQLDWRIGEPDRRSLWRTVRLFADALREAGLGHFEAFDGSGPYPPLSIRAAGRQAGTTRMHREPAHGVVDEHCRVHSLANLSVAGSSVFPSGGPMTPALTIVALAVRLADRLRAGLGASEAHVRRQPGEPRALAEIADAGAWLGRDGGSTLD